jgi:hypothetical protein
MESKNYFEGFNWPVPQAFSEALAKCKFEQGDVLYSNRCAYEMAWGKAKKNLEYSIQVISPTRSISSSKSDRADGVFLSNWSSQVEFELTSYQAKRKERKKTSQGNLYMALLHGNLSIVDEEEVQEPPFTVSEINRRLPQIPFDKTKEAQFLLAFDSTSEILREKRAKIETALKEVSSIHEHPAQSVRSLSEFKILPTISIVVFDVDLSISETESKVKEAVYVPVKNKKTDRERFRLRDHGLLR